MTSTTLTGVTMLTEPCRMSKVQVRLYRSYEPTQTMVVFARGWVYEASWWVMRVARGGYVTAPVHHTAEVRDNRRKKSASPAKPVFPARWSVLHTWRNVR